MKLGELSDCADIYKIHNGLVEEKDNSTGSIPYWFRRGVFLATDIGPRIGIKGEAEFNRAINNINDSTRIIRIKIISSDNFFRWIRRQGINPG